MSATLGFIADPVLDAQRRRDLRRMRLVATGLLVLAAIVYVITRGRDDGWLGFVNAGAEASMVGACADWFAVTALFRHPLGLPIPHTALIPRKKEMIGRASRSSSARTSCTRTYIRERVLDASRRGGPPSGPARRGTPSASSTRSPPSARTPCTASPTSDIRAVIEQAVLPRSSRSRSARWPVACSTRWSATRRTRARRPRLDEMRAWLVDNEDLFESLIVQRRPRGCRLPSTTSSPQDPHRGAQGLADIRRDPEARRPDRARQAAHRPGRRPPARPGDPGARERSRSDCSATRRSPTPPMSLWLSMRAVAIAALEDEEGPVRTRAVSGGHPCSPSGCSPTARCAIASTRASATRPSTPWSATARS